MKFLNEIFFLICGLLLAGFQTVTAQISTQDSQTTDSAELKKPMAPDAEWSAICTLKGRSVSVHLKSKSGDPFDDDMQAQLDIDGKKMSVPKLKALYYPILPSRRFQLCDKTMGLSIQKTKMLILMAKDDRPALDELTAILVDPESKKILDTNKNLGSLFRGDGEKQIKFERTPTGFRAWMAQGWNRNPTSDSAKELWMGWVNVSVKDGKILAKWEKTLPATHSQYSTPDVSAADGSKP